MRRSTILLAAAASLAAGLQAWAALRRPLPGRLTDLQVYQGGAGFAKDGGSLYDFVAANGAPFTYPPFAGLLMRPLTWLPFPALAWVWTVATVAVVALVAVVLARRAEVRGWAPAAVALALFASAPVSSNLRFGQVSFLLAALVLVDALRLVPERWAGVATGLAAAVKLTPLIFIPYLWFTGRRRAAVTATATFTGLGAFAWAVAPAESVRFWTAEVFEVQRLGAILNLGNSSVNGLLLRWEVGATVRTDVVPVIGLTIAVLALVRAVRADRAGHPLAAVVIMGAASLVLSPVSWTHHQIWLVLAALLVVDRAGRWWAAGVLAVLVLPLPALLADLPGGAITGDVRMLLAVAVATAVPFAATRRRTPAGAPADLAAAGGR
ncbi:glycosyltransferase 87 family protein [Spirilliplanes yamanashiensis]|nr:glycosyltransferase 87 family protein [Spirilliplanes yamanashiensis]MDP9819632.1 alpha-1,2-mannosyltransferase [Spirilliplanes yamanashiensis]